MARGFFGGLLIGGAVALTGAALLSVVVFPPSVPPGAPEMQAPTQAAPQAAGESTAPALTQTDEAPSAVPQSPAPATAVETAQPVLPDPAPTPTPMPQTADSAGGTPVAPQSGTAPLSVAPSEATPGQAPRVTAPAAPGSSQVTTLDTTPAAPVPTTGSAPSTAAAPQDQAAPVVQSSETGAPQSAAAPGALAQPEAAQTPQVASESAVAPAESAESAETDAPASSVPPQRTALPTVTPSAQNAEAGQEQAALVPGVGRPATSLIERSAVPATEPSGDPAQDSAAATPDAVPSALEAYAVPFEADEGRALVSIVLMDQGQSLETDAIGVAALSSFPYPLTFAVDVSLPDAADRMAAYRRQGFEVMALVDLPENLTGADTEVALSAALETVPEAVAVLEGPGTGLQGGRALSDQVSAILRDTGHGIVWQPKGLDTAQKLAAREGVASQTLFRDFDNADQTPTVIRRFLDQAAFKASQQGSVIMVGRLRGDTISALLVWGLQDRASRVAVAPVSAVLRAGLGG